MVQGYVWVAENHYEYDEKSKLIEAFWMSWKCVWNISKSKSVLLGAALQWLGPWVD